LTADNSPNFALFSHLKSSKPHVRIPCPVQSFTYLQYDIPTTTR
jgi:hypothetical protein